MPFQGYDNRNGSKEIHMGVRLTPEEFKVIEDSLAMWRDHQGSMDCPAGDREAAISDYLIDVLTARFVAAEMCNEMQDTHGDCDCDLLGGGSSE